MKEDFKLSGNELFRINNGEEQHYFTSLYRIGQFVDKQRAQVEYAAMKGKQINGWNIEIADGSDVTWKQIDEEK